MRSKRLLAMLLVICLVVSAFVPAASAVTAGADSVAKTDKSSNSNASANKTSPFDNDRLVSKDTQSEGIPTLRDDPFDLEVVEKNEKQTEGEWTVSPGAKPQVDLPQVTTPAWLKELKDASSLYKVDEVVRAFVVMEGAPLAENHKSPLLVSESLEKQMIEKQNSVIAAIEKTVLRGGKLNVRYQFTYLANAISVETAFANLEKIAKISGVKGIVLVPTYEPCEVSNPNTAASGALTGVHTVWQELGYTGQGMKIAIIDTGLDLDHPSFAALDAQLVAEYDSYMSVEDIDAVLDKLNAAERRATVVAKNLYRSTKVPYAFNYCDNSMSADHSMDEQGDHGTHVAGIAAANKLDSTKVVGMAPDAQIIVMKVFGANGGAYTDDIVAALEDAMTLGCDVVNASLGSPAGFSATGEEYIDSIYDMLASQDIVATISAGNEGPSSYDNMWGTDLNRTQNPENGSIGSPALYNNAFSIASAENSEVQTPYFALADGTKVFFNQTYEYYIGAPVYGMETLIGQELEFVVIDGLGNEEDFYDAEGNSLVEGKVAVVPRGEINFGDKVFNAELAGAVCCVITNNNNDDDIFNFYMNTELEDAEGNPFYVSIPACLVTMADGEAMAEIETKTMTVSEETAARIVEGGVMSDFSSWGTSSDLRLVPEITGIGGNVYSCYDGGHYGVMSGTSMSAPQIAGITALVMQALHEKFPEVPNVGAISTMAKCLLMSTADPIVKENGAEASPRQQGAGLVNAAEALKTNAVLVANGGVPKAELGDSSAGVYTFTFQVGNLGDKDETFTLSSSLLTEGVETFDGLNAYFMAGYDVPLTGTVVFSKDTVTVPAGESVTVEATITLSAEDKAMFAKYWENGGFVEGYVYLENADENGVDLNMPFMGFYGDWTKAPVFDSAYWYENSFWKNTAPSIDGDEYQHVLWTDLGGNDWVLGFNPYDGAEIDEDGNVVFNPANISVSPNGDGVIDGINEIYLSLLRNAKTLEITYTDMTDNTILSREVIFNNSKTMYRSSYRQVIPWIYSWYGNSLYDFADLPNNTKVKLSFDAAVDYEGANDHSLEFVITVDTEAPVLEEVYQITEEDGSHSLYVFAKDNVNVGAIFLMNPAGTQIYGQGMLVDMGEGVYGTAFNVDELGTELMIVAGDYAGNEGYYNITYTEAGDNLPEMDTSLLYAYRISDATIEYYRGYDYMFGWTAIEDPLAASSQGLAWLQPLTNDYMEYYALTAAEYAGGKVFAVDANQDLVVMEPGLWNRTKLCNLGVTVMDMTFDDSTDTMYLLTKQDSYYIYLMTLDLMTGEMENVAYLGLYYNGPLAMTDDDNGTLYMVKYGGSNLYYTSEAAEWKLAPVEVAVGTDEETGETLYENLELTHSDGSPVDPAYSQSMTYHNDLIYWAALTGSYLGEMIVIAPEMGEFVSSPIATYYDFADTWAMSNPELVGLISLVETDYQLPAAEALTGLTMSEEMLILRPGESASLSVSPTPWNYELGELTWKSSDESVVTVVDGKVTAVAEGTATITVSSGNISATADVLVVNTETQFTAYNYYSKDNNYGYLIGVDTGKMDYTLLAQSPVDFIAADYNGHDGYYYGYTEGGQLWRMDTETFEAVKIGTPISGMIADMAYDYSTGLMYIITQEFSMWGGGVSYLCTVDMMTGAIEVVYAPYEFFMMTLACDTQGNLFTITADGMLLALSCVYDEEWDEYMWMPQLLQMDLGYLQYLQSMCYDHANDVLLWAYPEIGSIVWADPYNGYSISLGDPTGSGTFEFVGMFTVPEVIPELPDVAVESVETTDMFMLVGTEQMPTASILPFNATSKQIDWTVTDATMIEKNADGTFKALKAGTCQALGTLVDEVTREVYELTINITVIEGADDIYGFIMTDLASMGGQVWSRLYAVDTSNPDLLKYSDYIIYAAEQYNGKLYAYGFDPNDWEANWQFFIMDAKTFAVEDQIDMGPAFPFVYDMTYDYNTSTMYATVGASDDDANLYIVDMETGNIALLMQTEQFFMSIAAAEDGIYLMQSSQEDYDMGTTTGGLLYKLDTETMSIEFLGDVGVKSNMIASMSYDYDTGMLYWTPFYQGASNESSLAMIDTETATATALGMICAGGAQTSSLFIVSENYPEEEDTIHGAVIAESNVSLIVGDSEQLNAITMPMGIDAEITWASADETIATVDENGLVTGVAQGKTAITATVTYKGVTKTCTTYVGVMDADAVFLSWNRTDMGWTTINRQDYTVVENLTEGETVGVSAIDAVDGTVYGVDALNQLFTLNMSTYEREPVAEVDVEYAIESYLALMDPEGVTNPEDYLVQVRDMAYDEANERMLVLATVMGWDADNDMWSEIYCGSSVYELDLTTGELEQLHCFVDADYVYSLAVDNEGTVYYYATFNDHICKLDLESGESSLLISTQTQYLYGEYGFDMRHALYFDELTNKLYMQFTSNAKYYRMLIIDVATGKLDIYDENDNQMFIGEVVYDSDSWSYNGDMFSAMTFVDVPHHIAMVNGARFETLEEAVAAAAVGDTIELLEDIDVDAVILPGGFQLDLKGYVLKTNYFVAFANANVIDSVGTGILACDSVRLDKDNTYMPVWDEENEGYRLFRIKSQQMYLSQSADRFVFIARPLLGSTANDGLMTQVNTNQLSVKLRLSWTDDDGVETAQVFSMPDNTVVGVYSDPTQVMELSVIGAASYAGNLWTDVCIVSETGVIWTSKDLLFKGE